MNRRDLLKLLSALPFMSVSLTADEAEESEQASFATVRNENPFAFRFDGEGYTWSQSDSNTVQGWREADSEDGNIDISPVTTSAWTAADPSGWLVVCGDDEPRYIKLGQ